MGILNNKERIMDTFITNYGKKELSKGNFKISYVAFSDKSAQYAADLISGSTDISSNLYFESVSLDSDQITFEADDSGKLEPFGTEGSLSVLGGKVLSGSSTQAKFFITGSQFSSLAGTLLSGSIENFNNLRIIGSKDLFLDTEDFKISQEQLKFLLTDNNPLPLKSVQTINVDNIESLFQDKRLSHVPNFKFLPPINTPTPQEPSGSPLGKYVPIGQENFSSDFMGLDYKALLNQLSGRASEVIEFVETSKNNNIFGQFFELRKSDLIKLDVIDFGSFPSDDPEVVSPHVFFVGKVFLDSIGRHTFVNIFTLIFS